MLLPDLQVRHLGQAFADPSGVKKEIGKPSFAASWSRFAHIGPGYYDIRSYHNNN